MEDPFSVSAEQVVSAFQRDFPREYDITMLRLLTAAQAARIAELEARPPARSGEQEA